MGLTTLNNQLYYFATDGIMRTGYRVIDGMRYYFDPDTGAAVTGFVQLSNSYTYFFNGAAGTGSGLTKINGDLYCLDADGIVRYGRIAVDGKLYYFDPQTGKAMTGWRAILSSDGVVRKAYFDPKTCCAATGLQVIDGALYYFDSYGYAKTGKRTVDGVRYFFCPDTCKAYTGWYKNTDGSYSYYDGANGLKTGLSTAGVSLPANAGVWGTLSGAKCFYDMNGKPVTGLKVIDGSLYYFDQNGKMKTGLQTVNGVRYYFGESGAVSGQIKINGSEYYFSPSSLEMLTGARKINGVFCYYHSDGTKQSGWVTMTTGDRLYIKTDGVQTGLAEIDGKTYYFGDDGVMRTGVHQVTAADSTKKICLFGANGAMVTGFVVNDNGMYYYDPATGARVTGFAEVGGKEYYFDPNTGIAATGLQNLGGSYYYFDPDTAQRQYGLQWVNGKLYYFTDDSAGRGFATGLTVIEGKTYCFSEVNGIARTGYYVYDGVQYYFDPVTCASVSGIYRRSDGPAFSFRAGGGVDTGWVTVGNRTYFFYPASGRMAEGLASVGDYLYYFDFDKGLLRSTTVTVGDVTYQFDENGHGIALGDSNLSKMINAGIASFDKGYGAAEDMDEPQNFTCSQLMMHVYGSIGIDLPRRPNRQYYALFNGIYDCEVVDDIDDAKAGDLIFFIEANCICGSTCDYWNEIHHVGVYLGEGRILESFNIPGDSYNNGPMIREIPDSVNSVVYKLLRIGGVNS